MAMEANMIAGELAAQNFFNRYYYELEKLSVFAEVSHRVLILNRQASVIYDTEDIDRGKLYAVPEVIQALNGKLSYAYAKQREVRMVVLPAKSIDSDVIQGVVVVMASNREVMATLRMMIYAGLGVIVSVIFLILMARFWLSGFITKPFTELTRQLNRIKDGNFDEIKGDERAKEIDEIISAANHMIRNLKDIEENHKQFVANVSHELKTPLSSIKVLSDSLLGQSNIEEELYQEFLQDISNEVERENRIINDLLTLSKMGNQSTALNIKEISVNELLETVMKRLKPLADKKGIQMFFESSREIQAELDEIQITLAFSNLVENAIKYNRIGGKVIIEIKEQKNLAVINVSDTGKGIDKSEWEHIFDPFFRVDKSYSRNIGGAGLGLALVKEIVTQHNGKVKVVQSSKSGTTVEMSLYKNI